jgi:uncharacterized protein
MKRMIVISFIVFIVIAIAAAALFLRPLLETPKKQTVSIDGKNFEVEIADSMATRAQGLSGRDQLGDDKGMLFIFGNPAMNGFWMKDMKFPIDMIWINGDRILGASENVQPEPGKSIFSLKVYYPPSAADKVLEVNAGTFAKYGFKAGDTIGFDIPSQQ